MAKQQINPAMLRWALADSGASEGDLADATGRDLRHVSSWLNGTDQPHKADLVKLATLLGRPWAFFFKKRPPESQTINVARRSALVKQDERTSRSELVAYRAAERIQQIARSLQQETAVIPKPGRMGASDFATNVRKWLDWNPQIQVSASSKSRLFKELRQRIEDVGIVVILRDIGDHSSRGFSLPDANVPLIFVNSSTKLPTVYTYTLLHEFAHLARDQARLHHSEDQEIERWCENFAAAFLMPAEHLREYISRHIRLRRVHSDDLWAVKRISDRYKASWHSVAIRLTELALADNSLIEAVKRQELPEKGWAPPGQRTTPVIRLEEFGSTFTRLVVESVGERISPLDAGRELRVNRSQLVALDERLRDRVA